ncbi:hypothetical protein P7C73_g6657, partial [Tremellales sp. Uapishka_1]
MSEATQAGCPLQFMEEKGKEKQKQKVERYHHDDLLDVIRALDVVEERNRAAGEASGWSSTHKDMVLSFAKEMYEILYNETNRPVRKELTLTLRHDEYGDELGPHYWTLQVEKTFTGKGEDIDMEAGLRGEENESRNANGDRNGHESHRPSRPPMLPPPPHPPMLPPHLPQPFGQPMQYQIPVQRITEPHLFPFDPDHPAQGPAMPSGYPESVSRPPMPAPQIHHPPPVLPPRDTQTPPVMLRRPPGYPPLAPLQPLQPLQANIPAQPIAHGWNPPVMEEEFPRHLRPPTPFERYTLVANAKEALAMHYGHTRPPSPFPAPLPRRRAGRTTPSVHEHPLYPPVISSRYEKPACQALPTPPPRTGPMTRQQARAQAAGSAPLPPCYTSSPNNPHKRSRNHPGSRRTKVETQPPPNDELLELQQQLFKVSAERAAFKRKIEADKEDDAKESGSVRDAMVQRWRESMTAEKRGNRAEGDPEENHRIAEDEAEDEEEGYEE